MIFIKESGGEVELTFLYTWVSFGRRWVGIEKICGGRSGGFVVDVFDEVEVDDEVVDVVVVDSLLLKNTVIGVVVSVEDDGDGVDSWGPVWSGAVDSVG